MTTIDPQKNICTLINVFSVEPAKHLELFNLLKDATEKVMSQLPGYISANLHIADDQKTITNYAQWASIEAFNNMQQNETAKKHMQEAAALAIDFKPATYHTIWTHDNDAEPFCH